MITEKEATRRVKKTILISTLIQVQSAADTINALLESCDYGGLSDEFCKSVHAYIESLRALEETLCNRLDKKYYAND